MAVDPAQLGDGGPFDAEETVPDPETDVADEMEPALQQQVVDLRDGARCGVLDREHGDIGFLTLYRGDRRGESRGPQVVDGHPLWSKYCWDASWL